MENFPNLVKKCYGSKMSHELMYENHRDPHLETSLSKYWKTENLESIKKKWYIMYRGTTIKLILIRRNGDQRQWNDYSMLKVENCQIIVLYPAMISFTDEAK